MTDNEQAPEHVEATQAPVPPPLPRPDWQPGVPPVQPVTPSPETAAASPRTGSGAVIAIAVTLALLVGGGAGLAGGLLGAHLLDSGSSSTPAKVTVVPSETSDPAVAAAAAAVPSVVNIEVRGGSTTSGGDSGLPQDHPDVPTSGNGSGVAYESAEGGGTYILTNAHVVDGAQRITVRNADGESVAAELVGQDDETDIAVVKVAVELPLVETADSSELLVGQTVVAIGSPYGLEHSVSSGIVSALGRSLPDFTDSGSSAYPLIDVIQTDAAINPGNSGGALVDVSGRLVGVNTAIYSDSGSSGGIGFAIPSNTAMRVADQLISGDDITHPFIGIVGQTVTEELVASENLTVSEGAYVVEVTPGTGSASAGVKTGDVVTAVDGEQIRSMDDLILQIRRKQVGDRAELTIVRSGQTLSVQVEVGDKPEDLQTSGGQNETQTAPTE